VTSASYVVLGMLGIGARSGYEVRRYMEQSARFFWTISPVQIYPELKRLEATKLVKGREDPRGGRPRRLYRLTAAGRRALRDWLKEPGELTVEWRDQALLKLFFADALDDAQAVDQLRALRERSERFATQFSRQIVPAAAAAAEREGLRYTSLVARFGLDFNEWVVRWCDEIEQELAPGG
jgi:PadR family transcriptional regulator, regulatory protein AphA